MGGLAGIWMAWVIMAWCLGMCLGWIQELKAMQSSIQNRTAQWATQQQAQREHPANPGSSSRVPSQTDGGFVLMEWLVIMGVGGLIMASLLGGVWTLWRANQRLLARIIQDDQVTMAMHRLCEDACVATLIDGSVTDAVSFDHGVTYRWGTQRLIREGVTTQRMCDLTIRKMGVRLTPTLLYWAIQVGDQTYRGVCGRCTVQSSL